MTAGKFPHGHSSPRLSCGVQVVGLGVSIGNAQECFLSAGLSQVEWAGLFVAMKRKSSGCSESGKGELFGFTLCHLGHGIWGLGLPPP